MHNSNLKLFSSYIACVFGSCLSLGWIFNVFNLLVDQLRCWIFFTEITTNSTYVETCENNFNASSISDDNNTISIKYTLFSTAANLGGIIGPFIFSPISDKFGRLFALKILAFLICIGAFWMSVSWKIFSYGNIFLGRLISGLSTGGIMTIAPIYLQEIAPTSGWAQIFGVSFSLGLNFGTLMGQVFGLKEVLGGFSTWQYIFLIGAIPSAIQLLTSGYVIESPVFDRKRNKFSSGRSLENFELSASVSKSTITLESNKITRKLQTPEIVITTPNTLPLPKNPLPKDSILSSKPLKAPKISTSSDFLDQLDHSYFETISAIIKNPKMRKKFLSASMYVVLQNWTGIPCIYFYSHSLFSNEFKLSGQSASYATLAVSGFTLLSILLSMFLITRIGIKYSYIISIFGMGVCSFSIYAAGFQLSNEMLKNFSLISTILFIAFSQIGVLPIPFMLVGEWFKPSYRTKCQAIIISLAFANTTLVGNLFLWMVDKIGNYTFFVLAINCGLGGIFALIQM